MTQPFRKNPLADYLAPKFGASYDSDVWTPELRGTIQGWLTHEITGGLSDALLSELEEFPIEGDTIAARARSIVSMCGPSEIVDAAHWAAVKTAPDLKTLLRTYDNLTDIDEIEYWLVVNATNEQLSALLRTLGPDRAPISYKHLNDGGLPQWASVALGQLAPEELLTAWQAVTVPDGASEAPVSSKLQATEDIRAWAKGHGYKVGKRGRLPKDILEEYGAAHAERAA